MSARVLDGDKIREDIKDELVQEIEALRSLGIQPGLAAVRVGVNPASKIYVRSSVPAANSVKWRE